MDIPIVTKRCLKMVKEVVGLYHQSIKVVEFMIKLHHGRSKKGKASVEALFIESYIHMG